MNPLPVSLGIDLGGTQIKGILLDAAGRIQDQLQLPTQDDQKGTGNWKEQVQVLYQQCQADARFQIESVGLAAPGLVAADQTAISYMPGRLQGLEGFRWYKYLNRSHLPVINDAHAALLAEHRLGAGKSTQNLLLLTLGTGVGGGLLINGQLHQGFLQRAGHVGHMSLDADSPQRGITGIPGNLEDAIGESTLQARALGQFAHTRALVEAYRNGDTWATYVWLNSVQKLAIGLASLINIVSPELMLLSGGITQAGTALFEPLNRFMALYEWRPGARTVPIRQAQFGAYAGAIGAAIFAREYSESI